MNATAANAETGGWHDRQRMTLTSYIPLNPALPTDYNCPKGACATPPPPPPILRTSTKEGFNQQRTNHIWIIIAAAAAAAAALFIGLARLTKRN